MLFDDFLGLSPLYVDHTSSNARSMFCQKFEIFGANLHVC